MRVLLINPFYPLTEMPSPPLGLAYVAGAFAEAGAEVRVLDLVVEAYSELKLEQLLGDFNPNIVGITSVTMTYNSACELLKIVKKLRPEITTLMGGPHVTFNARASLRDHPELDMAVLGEGEATIAELCKSFSSGSNLASIAGLAYRDDQGIRITETRASSLNVNSAPMPARHLLPMGRYKALGLAASMITSRGCPFKCVFCVGRKMSGAKVRYRDPISVVDEMEHLSREGFVQINIADDLFTAKKKHCYAICDEIVRRGLTIPWTVFSRANTISAELLSRLKQAGCAHISFGFESGNEDILKTVQKRITTDQMLNAARLCAQAGIPSQASFISGLPGETEETLRQTAAFADRINEIGTAVGFHILAPFPGTPVRDDAEELGLRILSTDWSRYTANEAVIETDGASAAMLEKDANELQIKANKHVAAIQQRIADKSASIQEQQNMRKLTKMKVFYEMMMDDMLLTCTDPDVQAEPSISHRDHLLATMENKITVAPSLMREFLDEGLIDGSILQPDNLSQDTWAWA
ncbi:MAG: B12-binding domain-containing radical SAM protein [Halieaceae bacterium]|jgi:anaerobic magnesium-protoporphyrin IX monomethyl ester cyclase|nr:B12-binding domain-containing radical SAM protein [Halieaceae bacterium]